MNAYVQSILSSEELFEHDRILEALIKHHPESTKWVIVKFADNKYDNKENKWGFTNIAAAYQWMKRRLDMESQKTLGKTFSLYKSPRMPYQKADEPAWYFNESVVDGLADEGYLEYNAEKTAAYPTDKVYENIPSGQVKIVVKKIDKNEINVLAYERYCRYNEFNT